MRVYTVTLTKVGWHVQVNADTAVFTSEGDALEHVHNLVCHSTDDAASLQWRERTQTITMAEEGTRQWRYDTTQVVVMQVHNLKVRGE
jgi:hypothetical protein